MPLPAAAIPLIAQGATSLAQIVGGIFGGRKARKEFENAEVPNYFDTEAYKTAESSANQAYRYAQEGLPEASRRMLSDDIARSGAAGLATTGSLRSGIAGASATAQTLADQYRNLASMDAQQRIQNRGTYFNQLNNLQQAQNVQADREYGNFLNQQASRLARMTANRETLNQGIGGLSQAGTLAFMAGTTPKAFGGWRGQGIFGGGKGNSPQGASVADMQGSTGGMGAMFPSASTLANYGLQQQGYIPLGGY